MFIMRPSRVLKKLRDGDVVYSFKHNLSDPRAIDIAGMFGFDLVWLCMEHIGNDWSAIESQIYAAKSWNMDAMVRVPRGSYSDYVRPLELDAAGILVPHIMGLEDAKNVVRMTRFHPIGKRPVDGGNADAGYCNIDFREYLKQANEQRFVAVQIEDPEPLDELDAICALEGIDIIFFGPGDFSHSIGVPGQWDHPNVAETRRRVAEAATKHGKFAFTPASPDNADELIEMGYRALSIGADVVGLSRYCAEIASSFGLQPGERAAGNRGGT